MGSIDIGRIGIWTWILDNVPSSQAAEHTAEAEALGYGAIRGTPEQIASRVGEHFDAGADHVGVQVLADDADATVEGWRILAPHLLN